MSKAIARLFLIVLAIAVTAVKAESAELLGSAPGSVSLMPCNECEAHITGWEETLDEPLWTAEWGDACEAGDDNRAFCDRDENDPDAECGNSGESLNNWCEYGCIDGGLQLALLSNVSRDDVDALSEMLSTPGSSFFFNASRGGNPSQGMQR